MKKEKFVVAMLGLALLMPTFNSCKKENHCLGTGVPEVVKTITLPQEVKVKAQDPTAVIEVTFKLTFKKGDEVVTEAKQGEKLTFAEVVSDNPDFEAQVIKLNGKEVQLPYEFVLGDEAPKVEISLEKKLAVVDLSAIAFKNAVVTFKKGDEVVTSAKEGEMVEFNIVANDGFELKSVTVDGVDVPLTELPREITLGKTAPKVEAVVVKKVQHQYGVVSLIGDAQPYHAWNKDYDMQKSETEDFTWIAKDVEMTHHSNGSRTFKFRADHAWTDAEWGGFTVTGTCEGTAHLKSEGLGNAKVAADAEGTYDITFNTKTLKYTFTKK